MGGLSKLGREGTLQEMAVNATRGGGISADGVPTSPGKTTMAVNATKGGGISADGVPTSPEKQLGTSGGFH